MAAVASECKGWLRFGPLLSRSLAAASSSAAAAAASPSRSSIRPLSRRNKPYQPSVCCIHPLVWRRDDGPTIDRSARRFRCLSAAFAQPLFLIENGFFQQRLNERETNAVQMNQCLHTGRKKIMAPERNN
jgi:hypothetical protein